MSEDEARQRVAIERQRRGFFSVRAAAAAAADAGARVSYTTWSDWETAKRPIGDSMRRAVMTLFGWPADWPENVPEIEDVSPLDDAVLRRVESLELRLTEIQEQRREESESMNQALRALVRRLDDLQRRTGT